jgi:hypothetical protein
LLKRYAQYTLLVELSFQLGTPKLSGRDIQMDDKSYRLCNEITQFAKCECLDEFLGNMDFSILNNKIKLMHGFDKLADPINGARLLSICKGILESLEKELLSHFISFKLFMPA